MARRSSWSSTTRMRLLMLHRRRRVQAAPCPQPRLGPDAPTVHFNDFPGNGETRPGAALGTRVRAVDLAELLEDPLALFGWNAGIVPAAGGGHCAFRPDAD